MRPITTQQVDVFNTVLYNFDWSPVFSTTDINEKVDVFLRITDGLINEFFPEKNCPMRPMIKINLFYTKDQEFND